jgi:hypothetical protein
MNAVFLAVAAEPNRSPLDFMLALMRDPQVPLDDRIELAAKAAPFAHRGRSRYGRSGPIHSICGTRPATAVILSTEYWSQNQMRAGVVPKVLSPWIFCSA